jgi:hypothetical protein
LSGVAATMPRCSAPWTRDGVPDATQPGSSIGGDLLEKLHVGERHCTSHPVDDEPVLLLIVTHGLLGARAKLAIELVCGALYAVVDGYKAANQNPCAAA